MSRNTGLNSHFVHKLVNSKLEITSNYSAKLFGLCQKHLYLGSKQNTQKSKKITKSTPKILLKKIPKKIFTKCVSITTYVHKVHKLIQKLSDLAIWLKGPVV